MNYTEADSQATIRPTDTTKAASPTQRMRNVIVGNRVTTASRLRDEWDEGKQRSSYVVRGEPPAH